MTTVVAMKAIKPKRLQVDAIRLEILNALRREGTEHKKILRKTVETWQGEKPKFETLIGLSGQDATAITGPVGSDKAVNKWHWLNGGTKIRWALMSRDWRSKTTPHKYQSRRGAGRVVIAGRRAMQSRGIAPRPGIKARGWSEDLTKQRKRPFMRAMIKAMQRGAAKAF